MASPAARVPTLPPCSENDFAFWRMKTVATLTACGLLGVCERPLAVAALAEERVRTAVAKAEDKGTGNPAAAADQTLHGRGDATERKADANEQVKDESKRAYAALIMSLNRAQASLVEHIPTGDAYGVWQALLTHYERKSVATRVNLLERLFGTKMDRTESVALYVARVQAIRRKLAEQEETISDTVLLFVLLRGLPEKFGAFVAMMKMQEIPLDEVIERLKNEEERLESPGKEEYATAHFAKAKAKGRDGGGGDGMLRCFTCHEEGHIKYNCPQNKNRKKCDRCHRVGHTAKECRAVHDAMLAAEQSSDEEWCS